MEPLHDSRKVLYLPFHETQMVQMVYFASMHNQRRQRTMEEVKVRGSDLEEPRKAMARLSGYITSGARAEIVLIHDALLELHERIDRVREMIGG